VKSRDRFPADPPAPNRSGGCFVDFWRIFSPLRISLVQNVNRHLTGPATILERVVDLAVVHEPQELRVIGRPVMDCKSRHHRKASSLDKLVTPAAPLNGFLVCEPGLVKQVPDALIAEIPMSQER